MSELEEFLKALKTTPISSEKDLCKQCNAELYKSYEKRYGVCERCQSSDTVDWEGSENDSPHHKNRVFKYLE